ncbi:MAG: hypothetical protein JWM11_3416 [Planctomycetaceae bacterium]|nr:hypothetical protein [Planctomycetaceae bacterium]
MLGRVNTAEQRDLAGNVARLVPGVHAVVNKIPVGGVESPTAAPAPIQQVSSTVEPHLEFGLSEIEFRIIRGVPQGLVAAGFSVTPQDLRLSQVEFDARRALKLENFRRVSLTPEKKSLSEVLLRIGLIQAIPSIHCLVLFATILGEVYENLDSQDPATKSSDHSTQTRLQGKLLTVAQAAFLLKSVTSRKDCEIAHTLTMQKALFEDASVEAAEFLKVSTCREFGRDSKALITKLNISGRLCGNLGYQFLGSIREGEAVLIPLPEIKSEKESQLADKLSFLMISTKESTLKREGIPQVIRPAASGK